MLNEARATYKGGKKRYGSEIHIKKETYLKC